MQNKLLQAERIESFKAGVIGAIATTLTFLLTLVLHAVLALRLQFPMPPLPMTVFSAPGLVSAVGVAITGFLFGITYRYIIRQDDNPQLKSGAVLAFGLVRGLAQMDLGLALKATPWAVLLLTAESMLLMAIARFALDGAIERGWVKRFDSLP